MSDISKITLPSGSTYNLKDETARNDIATLKSTVTGKMNYAGVTTTALSDGASTSPITIADNDYTPKNGDVVIYGSEEFVFSTSDGKWHEFGSTGSLKALAFKDSASGSITPTGSVSQPTFTGKAGTVSASYTPGGSVEFTTGTGTANYTPAGNVSAPSISVSVNTASITGITGVGTLPSCTLPSLSATVANETLTLGWSAGSFSAGSLPTKGNATTVATGIKSATASAPSFTGTGVQLVGTFKGNAATISASFTPSGTVSKPTFTGSQATVSVK